jgi:hypothetical protein
MGSTVRIRHLAVSAASTGGQAMTWPRGGQDEQWEYLVEQDGVGAQELQQRCNALGCQGWELVSVIPVSRPVLASGHTTGVRLFFKRRRQPGASWP